MVTDTLGYLYPVSNADNLRRGGSQAEIVPSAHYGRVKGLSSTGGSATLMCEKHFAATPLSLTLCNS